MKQEEEEVEGVIQHPGISPDQVVRKLEERTAQIIAGFKAEQVQPNQNVKIPFGMLNWLWRDRNAKAQGFQEVMEILAIASEENEALEVKVKNLEAGKTAGGIIIP